MASTLGENLKKLRTAARMSQYDLSRELGIHPVSVSSWERGVRLPDVNMTKRIAEFFNVTTDFLLDNDQTSCDTSELPGDMAVMFRSVDWKHLSEDERRIINAVIRSVIEKHSKTK